MTNNFEYKYKAKVVEVVDGDTIDVEISLGFNITFKQRFRLKKVDTPEIFAVEHDTDEYKMGMKAKGYVENKVLGEDVVIQTFEDETGKYGRYLAEVLVDGEDLGNKLLQENLAEKMEVD